MLRVKIAVALSLFLTLSSSAGHAQQKEPMRIGWVGGRTGGLAETCNPVREGISNYFDRVNSQGGIGGKKIEFISRDDEGKPDLAINQAQQLVLNEKVFAFVGTCGTPTSTALRDYLREMKILQFGPISQNDSLGNPETAGRTSFRVLPSDRNLARNAVTYLEKELGIPSNDIAVLTPAHDTPPARALQGMLLSRGSTFHGLLEIGWDGSKLPTALEAIRQQRPRAVIATSVPPTLAKAIDSAGSSGNSVWIFPGLPVGPLTRIHSITVTPVPSTAASLPGVQEFRGLTKSDTSAALMGWITAKVFVEGLRRAMPDVTVERTVKGLESLKEFDTGVIGKLTYSENDHQGRTGGYATESRDGKIVVRDKQLADACCRDCKPKCEDKCCDDKCRE